MTHHTPGPWEAVLDNDPRGQPSPIYRGLIALTERGDRTLAIVLGTGHAYETVPQEQWEPNAKLIAAAPAMADMLYEQWELERCEDVTCIDHGPLIRILRAAGRLTEDAPQAQEE